MRINFDKRRRLAGGMEKMVTADILRRMEEEAIYEMLHYNEKCGKDFSLPQICYA